jgi:hypothetical protein
MGLFPHRAGFSVPNCSGLQADLPRASAAAVCARTPAGCAQLTGDKAMIINTKIALAAALILGAASAAYANEVETNPSEAQSAREWREFLGQNQKHTGKIGTGYGYFASPSQQDDAAQSGKKGHSR